MSFEIYLIAFSLSYFCYDVTNYLNSLSLLLLNRFFKDSIPFSRYRAEDALSNGSNTYSTVELIETDATKLNFQIYLTILKHSR